MSKKDTVRSALQTAEDRWGHASVAVNLSGIRTVISIDPRVVYDCWNWYIWSKLSETYSNSITSLEVIDIPFNPDGMTSYWRKGFAASFLYSHPDAFYFNDPDDPTPAA